LTQHRPDVVLGGRKWHNSGIDLDRRSEQQKLVITCAYIAVCDFLLLLSIIITWLAMEVVLKLSLSRKAGTMKSKARYVFETLINLQRYAERRGNERVLNNSPLTSTHHITLRV
jgi:hypothetical protein